jgi:SSS family solute:Na+ symporter
LHCRRHRLRFGIRPTIVSRRARYGRPITQVVQVPTTAEPISAGLQPLDYAVVVSYLLVTLAIVVWASRRQRDTDDFFLGGRKLPWLAVGLSIMATLLSSITYLGLTGEVVKHGIAGYLVQLAMVPAVFVVAPLFIPFFMRLRFTSAYEYLEHRFDYRARLLGSTLFLLLRVGWVSLVMYTGSFALAKMAGWDLYRVILVLGVTATLYAGFGGLKAVVWTDVLQALMLFGGAAAIVLYVWYYTGQGPSAWWAAAGRQSAEHTSPPFFSFDPTVRMTVVTALLSGFMWQICTHCSDQVVLQRYASTPSLTAARNSYLTNIAASLSITTLLGVSGLALLFFYLEYPRNLPPGVTAMTAGDELMPYFYANQLPIGCGGLILANFLCDAMQTLVSGVNSVTAVASQDVVEHGLLIPRSNKSRLWTARMLTLGLGVSTTFIALGVARLAQSSGKNIVDLMPRTFNMFLGPLGSLFLIGMFVPRVTGRTVTPAVLAALGVSIAWSYCRELFGTSYDLSINLAIFVPCVTAVAVAWLLSLLFDRGPDHPGSKYSWHAVMRRPERGD